MESIAKEILNKSGGLDKIKAVISSPENMKMMESLVKDAQGDIKKVAQGIEKGDSARAKMMLSEIASTKEGAQLISKIMNALSSTGGSGDV